VNDLEALRCDEIMAITQDILAKCPQGGDEAEKKAAREKYAAGPLRGYFDLMSKRLGTQDFFTPSISIADLVVQYACCDVLRVGLFDYIPTDFVEGWPNLLAHEARVAAWVKANDKK
jgi:glutathione S-transferase